MDEHEITLYEYDGRSLVTREINALGDGTLYTYDGNGNLVSRADADGYVTDYSYSPLDLVSAINYNGAKQAAFQYNKAGELVRMDDWTGVNTFELDLLGQLKKATDHKGNVTEYTYDEVGNQTSVKYPDGGVVQNTYDEVYNLTKVKDPDQGVYTYIYDAANRAVEQIYPNGWIEENTYDPEGNLLKVMDTDPFPVVKKTVKKFEYKYDAEGNLIWEYKRDSDGIDGLVSCTDYTYDALNQLTGSARATQGYPNSDQKRAYEYDSLGNLVRETRPENGQNTTLTYQYNNLNQMVHKQDCSYISSITRLYDYGYTYDKRGNLVKEEEICAPTTQGPRNITIATYRYDETNKMVSGTNADGEYSNYTYNGLGVRVGTELILNDNTHGYTDFHCRTPSVETGLEGPHGPEVVLSDYVIDYTRLNIDQRVLMEHEVDGYDFRYVYGLDLVNVKVTGEGSDWWGQNIKQCIFSDYVHTDRLGSVVNLSDQYGRVPARIDYDAWGSVTAYDSITVDGGFRILLPEITYAGHQYDDILNQYYAKARMYDADSRRFTAVDPVKGDAEMPLSLAQYIYVINSPLRYIDPLGLMLEVGGGTASSGEVQHDVNQVTQGNSPETITEEAQGHADEGKLGYLVLAYPNFHAAYSIYIPNLVGEANADILAGGFQPVQVIYEPIYIVLTGAIMSEMSVTGGDWNNRDVTAKDNANISLMGLALEFTHALLNSTIMFEFQATIMEKGDEQRVVIELGFPCDRVIDHAGGTFMAIECGDDFWGYVATEQAMSRTLGHPGERMNLEFHIDEARKDDHFFFYLYASQTGELLARRKKYAGDYNEFMFRVDTVLGLGGQLLPLPAEAYTNGHDANAMNDTSTVYKVDDPIVERIREVLRNKHWATIQNAE
ncbi:hypothetical protein CE91St40_28710 [Oscillospiraceae bacterium]|nr:hypothetical protein CE91St40_28710 [Oscillospiraceae bacterium]